MIAFLMNSWKSMRLNGIRFNTINNRNIRRCIINITNCYIWFINFTNWINTSCINSIILCNSKCTAICSPSSITYFILINRCLSTINNRNPYIFIKSSFRCIEYRWCFKCIFTNYFKCKCSWTSFIISFFSYMLLQKHIYLIH